jgi:hypothetical protein
VIRIRFKNIRKTTWMLILGLCCYSSFGCAARVNKIERPRSETHTVRLSDLLSDEKTSSARPARATQPKVVVPTIAALPQDECYELLKKYKVDFKAAPEKKVSGIRMPIQLTGTLNGLRVSTSNKRTENTILDCRLAVALLKWTEVLSAYGFTGVDYISIYRRNAHVGGSSKVSGHAHGLAIDIRGFTLGENREIVVLDDWIEKDRGDDPCSKEYDEPVSAQLMRRAVCEAGAQKLFQVVLTPHYNDAHANHVHLEVVPDVDWEYIK